MNAHPDQTNWDGTQAPNYVAVYARRAKLLTLLRSSEIARIGALEHYRTRPVEFINDWVDTFDPRGAMNPDILTHPPFVMFQRQIELVQFLQKCLETQASGLIEKSRDMGATWVCVAFSVWLWRFHPGAAVGWGSRKQDLVDQIGDPKSIFEKIRQAIYRLPRELWPKGFNPRLHMSNMRVLNPENDASIIGEIGDEIGRGGRTLVYFKDEAQTLNSRILTPDGWQTMADMKVGSVVIGANGKPRNVTHINDAGAHPVYRFTFSDGHSVECSPNHLWAVEKVHGKRESQTLRAHEIAAQFRYESPQGQVQYRYRVKATAPVEFAAREKLPLDPYIVGALLGDGSVKAGRPRITSADSEIVNEVARLLPPTCVIRSTSHPLAFGLGDIDGRRGRKVSRMHIAISQSGIWGMGAENKHIPDAYKMATPYERLGILQGLMDTDGSASGGVASYHTCSRQLADDVAFIVQSLGGVATMNIKPDHRGYRDMYVLHIALPDGQIPFRLSRKVAELKPRKHPVDRSIVAVELLPARPVRCITVDADDGVYLTDHFIATHNSAHYQRPELIEAALGNNTNVQIDISSVNGTGNVFHRKRRGGAVWAPGADMVRNRTNVFVFDWTENPLKDQAWYDNAREKAESEGLMHVFEQEVNRNYDASKEGIIIPQAWVLAARNAHKKFPAMLDGPWRAGFDPYNEGKDKHALVKMRGSVIKFARQWTKGDTGEATREVVIECRRHVPIDIQFDAIGIGAGVTAESNRLAGSVDENEKMPKGMTFIAFVASDKVLRPDEKVDNTDEDSKEEQGEPITNKQMFHNLKAQAWWDTRRKFERTWRAVTKGEIYSPMDMISIDTESIPTDQLAELESQLSQPVRKGGQLKIIVDKTPDGSDSPNLGDATVICSFQVSGGYVYDLSKSL